MRHKLCVTFCLGILLCSGQGFLPAQSGSKPVESILIPSERADQLAVSFQSPFLLFTLQDPRIMLIRLQVYDGAGNAIYDSGEITGAAAGWDSRLLPLDETVVYDVQARDGEGSLLRWSRGEIGSAGNGDGLLLVTAYDVAGNYTIGGNLGVGTSTPERAIHLKGSNAVFRMDRSHDTAAFMLVRTDTGGTPLKAFVAGVDASGTNQGQFVINDLGASVAGAGTRRMTIATNGDVTFTGNVRAAGYTTTGGSTVGGLSTVTHGTSLTGSGTSASPLEVANGGVTPAMFSASGSSAGQVLTSNGTNTAWQTPSTGSGGGITSVVHDATLNGSGVTGSPLGVAGSSITSGQLADNSVGPAKIKSPGVTSANIYDNAVTLAKLSVSGTAAAGLVLGTNGTSLVWQDDDLSLPYSDSASTAAGTDAMRIDNTGGGRAIHAVAVSDSAVWGVSSSGQGLAGHSTSGDGVEGKTDAAGKSGVFGHSTAGAGVTGSSTDNDGVAGNSAASEKSGVFGSNSHQDGYGVAGRNSAMSNSGYLGGYNFGVKGTSTLGPGVMGETTSTHQRAAGVFGRTTAEIPAGVRGEAECAGANAIFADANNPTGSGSSTAGIWVQTWGSPVNAGVFNGRVVINGVLHTWGGEYKLQPHPADPAKQLSFGGLAMAGQTLCVRGGGQLQNGRASIELPDYFAAAAAGDGLTVHITPTGDCNGVFVTSRSVARIELRESRGGDSDATFDYLIMAPRRGFEEHAVIQENEFFKPLPRISVEEFEASLAKPENRPVQRLLMENGTLTPDGKLNREAARRLGWQLGPATRAERLGDRPK